MKPQQNLTSRKEYQRIYFLEVAFSKAVLFKSYHIDEAHCPGEYDTICRHRPAAMM